MRLNINVDKRLSNIFFVLLTLYMSSTLVLSANVKLIEYSRQLFMAAFGVCFIYAIKSKCKLVFDPYIKIFFLFILFCLYSRLWAEATDRVDEKVKTLMQLWMVSVVLMMYWVHTKNIRAGVAAIFLSGVLSCIYIFVFYGIDGYMKILESGERAGGELANVNTIGMYMATTVLIGFFYAYIEKKIYMYVLIIPEIIIALGSGSRKALVMLVAGIVFLIIVDFINNYNTKKLIGVILIMSVLVMVFLYIKDLAIFSTIFRRFNEMIGNGTKIDHSTLIRKEMIEVGWEYFKKHPFSGSGIGNTSIILRKANVVNIFTYLHNNFIEILASVGIFGFFIYYSMYFYILYNLGRIVKITKDKLYLMIFVLLCMRLIMEYGMVTYYDKMHYIYLTLGAATVYVNKDKLKEV